jgi:signal transduction histidine kinase
MRSSIFCCALALAAWPLLVRAEDANSSPPTVLQTIAEVDALSFDQANHKPAVLLRAIVIYYKPGEHPDLVVEDEAGDGVYVFVAPGSPQFTRGQWLEITGAAAGGNFAPVVRANAIRILGRRDLPVPRRLEPTSLAELQNARFVEIDGVISSAVEDRALDPPRLLLDLRTRAGILRLWVLNYAPKDRTRFIDAEVRVRGVGSIFGNQRNEPVAQRFLVGASEDITILGSPAPDPFALPLRPLNSIMRYDPAGPPRHRIHVRGTVSYAGAGDEFYLADQLWGVRVLAKNAAGARAGDLVEVVGFATMGSEFAEIEDAEFRVTGRETLQPRLFDDAALRTANASLHSGALVRVRAEILDVLPIDSGWKLLAKSAGRSFDAILHDARGFHGLGAVRTGSEVWLTGIWQPVAETSNPLVHADPTDFRILLRSHEDVAVIRAGPWWTSQRLKRLLAGLLIASAAVLLWTLFLRRQNLAMKREIAARVEAQSKSAEAQAALEAAKANLERRVEERSARIVQEIEARRGSEVRFAAIAAERNRLARDLHDTVEQMLTGAGVQLSLLRETLAPDQETSIRRLDLASSMLREAKVEARRSIWDLQPHALEEHSLVEALAEMARQFTDGSRVECQVRVAGSAPDLPILLESQILRIGQEAITNAVKHAGARRIVVHLAFSENEIRLTVTDDGCGFDPDACGGLPEGHFGLTGMRERALRLDGSIEIESAPGQGTIITVILPMAASLAAASLA